MAPSAAPASVVPNGRQFAGSGQSGVPRAGLRLLGVGVLGLLLGQYLSGVLLLEWLSGRGEKASVRTVASIAYYHGAEMPVRRAVLASLVLGHALTVAILAAALWPKPRALHGEARFASRRELARAGLLGVEGIILGAVRNRYLMLAGQQGVALAAPPRAGKGTGIVVPNALNWSGSLVCVDIKRENWSITAGARVAGGQACHLFDPFAEDGRTARWNPFFYVAADPRRRVNDLQRIAEMLYPDPPNVDPFWTASARSLFLGIALYLFETPSLPRTIGEVLRQGMASAEEGFGEHWKRVIEGRLAHERPLSSECVRALYDVIDLAPVTASSIRKTFTSRLDLWLNPILDAATAGNDFDLRELRRKPMSIYVGVNPDDLHRLRPVLSLFFQQAIGLQTRELPEHNRALKLPVMMLLDEFTALGRIPIMAEAISYLPGYNVRVLLVIQTPSQLREVYGNNNAETMLKSLAARIVFAPKDYADAREISDELGTTTVKVPTISRSRWGWGTRKPPQVSESQQKRALLLPQEVKDIGVDEALIFYEGLPPIRCRKIRYFADKRFSARVRPPPSVAPIPIESTPVPPARDSRSTAASTSPMTTFRDSTIEDLDRIDTLTLEDFPEAPAEVLQELEKPDGDFVAAAYLFVDNSTGVAR
ncbi:MAG: hypothetical protein AMXMBFR37_07180 [Steroidobacteraceae bacterium]|jgi:type IV secretion system protein VirD4